MRMRLLALVSGLAVVVATATAAAAQATDRRVPEKTGRTSWGDPDLQGNYTNLYEDGTPLERPDEFAGRTLDQIRGDELARIKQAVQACTIGASRAACPAR